jgi:predicted DNA-binding transcriptional regulator AlpA
LSDQEVAARFSVSRATIWRWVDKVSGFPYPIKTTPGTTRWKVSDLVRFETIQAEKRPLQLEIKMAGGVS